MITVIALVFSLTIVALQISSTQFSPRLLRNFLRDRPIQVVLSVFVSTFAYSTAGLFAVGVERDGREFVPGVAVSGALLLGFASLGMLVFYIHHVAHSIQVDTIMEKVQLQTLAVAACMHPRPAGRAGVRRRRHAAGGHATGRVRDRATGPGMCKPSTFPK